MLPAVAQNARSGSSDPKEHNKHLFEKYIQDLASDGEEEFIFAALKLTKFLAKVEAYYPEAHASVSCHMLVVSCIFTNNTSRF